MSSTYYSSHQSVGWGQKIEIGYGGYVDGFLITLTALTGIWLLALLGITIWAACANKSRSAIAASVFRIHKFWLAMVLAIV